MSASSGGEGQGEGQGEMPYYTTVSRVRDSNFDISLVTLPAGTILFRGIRMPTDNPLAFYTDYLGTPSSVGGVPTLCLKPTHNVFFYAQPLVSFGAHNVGSTFDAVQVVVLVKDVNVVCMIRPSMMVRGEGKRYSGNAPIQRCSNFKESCGKLTEEDIDKLSYDNCLSPDYQRRSFTRGWMAIANLDSIEPKLEDERVHLTPSMGPYLKGLESRQPGVGSLLTASTYVDATRTEKGKTPRTGFPEIVLYPYASPPSDVSLHQPCSSDIAAMALLAKHAKKDNLLYLPIATITGKGIVDMIGGHFAIDRVASGGNQQSLELYITKYLNNAMRYGVRLPFYGNGTISFDTRTGFYILPQVAETKYKKFILPMDSNQQAKRKDIHTAVRKYLITARTYSTDSYMKDISLPTGTIQNSFIFSRPLLLAPIFKAVGISLPKDMYEYLKEASDAYKSSKPLTIRAPTAASAASAPATASANLMGTRQGPGTPEFGGEGPGTPTYGPATPTYGPVTPVGSPNLFGTRQGPGTPEFGTPVAFAANGSSNKVKKAVQDVEDGTATVETVYGGYGKPINPYGLNAKEFNNFRKTLSKGGNRRGKKTRKQSKNPLKRYAEQFSSLWKLYAKKKNSK